MLSTFRAQQLASLLVDPDANFRLAAVRSLYEAGFDWQTSEADIVETSPRWWIADPQLHDEIEQFLNVELNKSEAKEGKTYFNGLLNVNLFLSFLCLFVLCLLTRFVSMACVVPLVIDLILIYRLARELW